MPTEDGYFTHEDYAREQNARILGSLLQSIIDTEVFYYSRGPLYMDEHEDTLYDLYEREREIRALIEDLSSDETLAAVENILQKATEREEYERKVVTDSVGD